MVKQHENSEEAQHLFENSNAQADDHKQWIKENDQERQINIQWAKTAFEKYEDMMKDFTGFKEKINKLFSESSKQYRDEILDMKVKVDQSFYNQQNQNNRMELVDQKFAEFDGEKQQIRKDIDYLFKQTIGLQTKKLDEESAVTSF